jgi:nucleotide-binding universal stress UspA family protein
MRRIMVATDGSEGADRAVDVAAQIAKGTGGELSILHVGGTLSSEEMRQLARTEKEPGDALEELSNQILGRATERAERTGLSRIVTHTAWGDAAEAIIEAVPRDQLDAVVVGRRGRGRLAGLLLGSVSQKVASLAPCVVMVVP